MSQVQEVPGVEMSLGDEVGLLHLRKRLLKAGPKLGITDVVVVRAYETRSQTHVAGLFNTYLRAELEVTLNTGKTVRVRAWRYGFSHRYETRHRGLWKLADRQIQKITPDPSHDSRGRYIPVSRRTT